MATITLTNIAHTYQPTQDNPLYALKKLDMAWEDGGTYALLGPSGCGKTTMLNIISGLLYPSDGQVLFDDLDVTREPTKNRNIAQVFQFPVIYTRMSVGENLAFPLVCRGIPVDERKRRVAEVADLLNLSGKLSQPANKLAADEKQLISLGRGLVRNDVSALLLDEPLTVIDPQLKFHIRRKLKEINERYRLTMVFVTHDQNEAMSFADTVVVMKDGQVVQAGSPETLYERPETTFVGYFIGSPAMNFIQGRVSEGKIRTAGGDLDIPPSVTIPRDVEELQIGIRPRYAQLTETPGTNSLKGRVRSVQELGTYRIVTFSIKEEIVRIKLSSKDPIPGSDTIAYVSFPPSHTCLYGDGKLIS